MRPCTAILTLLFFPLALGAVIGVAVVNSALTALEDAERERREDDARHTELRWFIWSAAHEGPVIEHVMDGGQTVRSWN